MRRSSWTPSIVPRGDAHNVYLVMDDLGRLGRVWRETDDRAAELEAVILDLLAGQYKSPVRVVGFNTAEEWSQDVSADVRTSCQRCDQQQLDKRDVGETRHGPREPCVAPARPRAFMVNATFTGLGS